MFKYLITKTMVDVIENFTKVIIMNSLILFLWGIALLVLKSATTGYTLIIIGFYAVEIFLSYLFSGMIQKTENRDLLKKTVFATIIKSGILIFGYLILQGFSYREDIFGNTFYWLIIWIILVVVMAVSFVPYNNSDSGIIKNIARTFRIFIIDFRLIAILYPIKAILFLTNMLMISGAGTAVVFEKNLYEILDLKYEYIRKNGMANIRWDIILKDEVEKLERKNIQELLFPWKGNDKK